MRIRELMSPDDPALDDWIRIYLASFPEPERMSLDYFRRVLQERAAGAEANKHLLVQAGEQDEDILGMAYYETQPSHRTSFLWYLAVDAGRREHGLGTALYEAILNRIGSEPVDLLIFEVDIPSDDDPNAARRIAWYQRLGARVLTGIEYFQTVDSGFPPVPMLLMIHPIAPLSSESAFDRACLIFEDAITQTGPLGFDPPITGR